MNFSLDYDDNKERRKTYPLLLPKIEAITKGGELKKNPVRDSNKSIKIALGKTQAVDGNGLHKAAEKLL